MARILVVDDTEMMRDSLASTLVRDGHEVIASPDYPFDPGRLDLGAPEALLVLFLAAATVAGYVLSGVFVMEPGAGFPEGAPMEHSGSLAWHTVTHLIVGTVAFAALTAALFVLGRSFARPFSASEMNPSIAVGLSTGAALAALLLPSATASIAAAFSIRGQSFAKRWFETYISALLTLPLIAKA